MSETVTQMDRPLFSVSEWVDIYRTLLVSRAIDHLEESELVPAREVYNQFSARGHDFAQILLGHAMNHPHDAAAGYYRSRPFLLAIGLGIEDALSAPLARSGSYSDGRDIGVVCNLPGNGRLGPGCTLLPMSGGVGAQYTPISGWAQSIRYHQDELKQNAWKGAIATAMGGDASLSTNGFWSALNIATAESLPYLFYVEDNGYGISVPADVQTAGGDHVASLASFRNLTIIDGDGTDPGATPALIRDAVRQVRDEQGPCLLRLKVPRLCGHTFQDTQTYKPKSLIEAEQANDPKDKLEQYLLSHGHLDQSAMDTMASDVDQEVRNALTRARDRAEPDPARIHRYVYAETNDPQIMGGLVADQAQRVTTAAKPEPTGSRLNMLAAIRQTLDQELSLNPKMLVFGEDVGPKGGVHAVTLGLHDKHGQNRVFDTSLSEEGIIGRASGLAVSGLLPVPEIQFRKYAEPAAEQLSDVGTMRWRTANRFAAPMVVRVPGGHARRGDPWHSVCDEVEWAHKVGWQVAFPSNASDAVGLLRTALRDNNPTVFFEHRALYDLAWSRRPWPGDDYGIEFGSAATLTSGDALTVVCWGAMVPRVMEAVDQIDGGVEVLDLRTIMPWDKDQVMTSVKRTGRCLIVHEDNQTAGFGAEIAAVLVDELFWYLDSPIKRLTMRDIPSPHNAALLDESLPSVATIARTMTHLMET